MLLIAENIIQIIFLILSLSVNSSREGARMLASFKHTPHQKHGMSQSVTNAGESQWAFDYPAVNLSFEAATFEFVTSVSVSAGFTVYGWCFYSSIVIHSMSEKTLFVGHGKQSKHYMTSKG